MNIHVVTKYIPKSILKLIKFFIYESKRTLSGRPKIETRFEYEVIKYKGRNVFFGYYDISPYNIETDEVLCLITSRNKKIANICLWDINKKTITKLAETKAWNWQQGSRQRWMPNNNREIIFNDYDGSSYFCNIFNVDTNEKKVINYPIYDISPDGRYGITLNFERLGVKRPGYGYVCAPYKQSWEQLVNEGVDIVSLSDGKKERLFSYGDIASFLGNNKHDFDNNYINHLSFSPNGDKFLFFWLTIRGNYHYADLLVYDITGNKLMALERGQKASHYVWTDNNTIICTIIDNNNQCHYIRYSLNRTDKEVLSPYVLNSDGHPSYIGDDTILTDTYPDANGFQRLFEVNLRTNHVNDILSIYHNCMRDGELRTDLHPRYIAGKNLVVIDSCANTHRKMLVVRNVPSIV